MSDPSTLPDRLRSFAEYVGVVDAEIMVEAALEIETLRAGLEEMAAAATNLVRLWRDVEPLLSAEAERPNDTGSIAAWERNRDAMVESGALPPNFRTPLVSDSRDNAARQEQGR